MMSFFIKKTILGLTVFTLGLSSQSRADLESKFKYELQFEKRVLSVASQKVVNQYHVVFIAGIMNEMAPGYFHDNINSLKLELGSKNYSVIRPQTTHSVEENGLNLSKQLRNIYEKNKKKPLIIIAHSKGGLEVLDVLFRDSVFFNDAVTWAVFVQTPFMGSPVADFFFKKCDPKISKGLYCNAGYHSIMTDVSAMRLDHQLSFATQSAFDLLHNKVRLVRASKDVKDVSLLLKFSAELLAKQNEPNDGMVLLRDQIIPGFNLDLGVLESDHFNLLTDPFISNQKPKFRRAFTRALFSELLHLSD